MATPPVVFKTIKRIEVSSDDALKLTHFNIEFDNSETVYGHYLLASHSDPANPIKLYQSAMNRLLRNLNIAFEEVDKMEKEQRFGDNELYDCGIINSYEKMEVRLVISTSDGMAQVWLRLYTKNEDNQTIATKLGVQFSPQDNLAKLAKFVQQHKKK
jgi:hypothetical protein